MVIRLYSDRLRDAARAGQSDVYQYESFPPKLRVQVRRIIRQALGDEVGYIDGESTYNESARFIRETLCQALGRDVLGGDSRNPVTDLMYFIEHGTPESFLDAVDISAGVLHGYIRENQRDYDFKWHPEMNAKSALAEINFRFRDAGVGFQVESGKIVRMDSEYAHAEVVKPALSLLNCEGYEGPQAEFLAAHDHYRAGRNEEAIIEAAKAFESLMKVVCKKKGWECPAKGRASDLVKILRSKNLWPSYLDASFDQLLATLQSGLPKVRNESAAHGQGVAPRETPAYVAAYALHLAGAKMIFIAEAAEGH